ncbi:hypothetical protein KC921_03300 [Candidatus Woesebacteria bacterium]|nr:hypothetical protein [Candidatus Woesebacteria bacterium]
MKQKSILLKIVSIVFFSIGCFSGVLLLHPYSKTISAQTSTESGSIDVRLEGKDIQNAADVTPDPESINKAINERINKQLSDEQEKKLSTMLDSINQLRKAMFGQVERITDDSLTLTTSEGAIIIPLPESVVVKQDSKTIKASDIAVDSWALVIGTNTTDKTSDAQSTLTPQQILIYTTNPQPKGPIVSIGVIDSINSGTVTIVDRATEEISSFTIQKTTVFQDAAGKKITSSDLEPDLAVLIVGTAGEKTTTANIIRSLAATAQKEGV